jgi:cellulose synthase operon protein C
MASDTVTGVTPMLRTCLSFAISGAVISTLTGLATAQIPPEQQAEMLLGAAQKAYNERNLPFAADKFREFLQKFGGHARAVDARYGLALACLEMPERKYAEAIEQLQSVAGNRNFSDYRFAVYYLGLAKRAQGLAELSQALTKPNEAPQRKQNANQRFTEAQQQFAAAAAAFKERVKPDPMAKEPSIEREWLARSLCDQAEMELRLNKAKEAQQSATPFARDPAFARSRYLRLGLYYHGYASFLVNDFPSAARALNRQDVQTDIVFGSHARYLMGRVHQHDGELAEAGLQYQAVLDQYAREKLAAQEALKKPDQFKNNPEERLRLEQLIKSPPDHVTSAAFAAATLHYEAGRFAEALARFTDFSKLHPDSPRTAEAVLHAAFCQVQLKQYQDAINALGPLAQKQAALADQALLWLGKAQALNFDPNNLQARTNALNAAISTLKQAADRAGQMANSDPEARTRRAEIQLELADVQQTAGQNREAATIYEQLLNEKNLASRSEELTQRLADAWSLAGDYPRSDQVCDQFMKSFPQSPLRPAVAFRQAENAYFVALNAAKNPNLPKPELEKSFDEAAKRFQVLIEKYPEFERLSLARYSLAVCQIQKGEFEKAAAVLEAIPPPDRTGDLAIVPYQWAACLIRLTPTKTDDAIVAGKVQEQMQIAAQLLDAFASANPQSPLAPDALLKLGHCQQRLAAVLAQAPEKQQAVQAARQAYEKLMNQYPRDARVPQAVLERAKCMVLVNDRGGAINELKKFAQAPLQDAPIAPMALVRLATLFREQNQAAEAVKVLDECRKKHEGALGNDKERASWVPQLKYHHGVALLESAKPGDARPLFDQVAKDAADKSVAAEAALRGGQCRTLEAKTKLESARQKLGAARTDERAAAEKAVNDALVAFTDAGKYLESQAESFKQSLPGAEPRARMLYDAAWAHRFVADMEINSTRTKMQQDEYKRLIEAAQKKNPNQPVNVSMPEIARAKVPLQPAEERARNAYKALIAQFADLPLAGEARLEFGEMLAEREELIPAIALLKEALDKEPAQELTDRIRLRLGCCLAAKKDAKGAMAQFDAISDPKSPLLPQAQYRAGECLLELGDAAKAVQKLTPFRDKPEYQNIGGLTDRALLRLGHALAKTEQWEASRQALETMVGRFGNSPWVLEARYGIGWARQKLKQYDEAVNWYNQVANATTTELGAKSHLQIGLCRMEQKRYAEAANSLLIVPYTFDYPELNAAALCQAAVCLIEVKQAAQAEKLLQKVLREHADSEWAKVAKEKLEVLKKG